MQPEIQEILDDLSVSLSKNKEITLNHRLSCNIASVAFANRLLSLKSKSKVFIIESCNHSVVYDGKDTWDLNMGFVLRNYRYPDKDIPTKEFLPYFNCWFEQKWYDKYYSTDGLNLARRKITVKELKILGVIDGTKEEKGRKAY
jgi:hypothetical protein|tara:strand:- start:617 stop:1048 length:432 start_codon:yes stop_codon:yes gene_type:complete